MATLFNPERLHTGLSHTNFSIKTRQELRNLKAELFDLTYNNTRPLSYYGEVDTTGTTDMAGLINTAIADCASNGLELYIGAGTYRLASSIYVKTNTVIRCHPFAEFVAYFNTSGSNGIVTLSPADWALVTTTPLNNIKISGGIWRRNGTLSGDGLTWTGNTGNIFSFWAEHVDLRDIHVTGYNRGRVVLGGGRHWTLDRIISFNENNYLNLPCPGIGGTGAFRWYSGGPMVGTRLYAIAGDDILQAVPGAVDEYGIDVEDIIYSDCYGYSVKARVCVAALVVPNSFDEELQGSQTIAIRNVTFRGIRGSGKILGAFYNTDSSGSLGTILLDDVRVGINTDLDGAAAPYALEVLGTDLGSGAGPIIVRDSEVLNLIEGGVRCRGTEIGTFELHNWMQPAPSNGASTSFPLHVQDCEKLVITGGCFFGHASPDPGNEKSVLYIGRTDNATNVKNARIKNVDIKNIPEDQYGVFGPLYGFEQLDMEGCRLYPLSGVTTARAVRFSEVTAKTFVRYNDFSLMNGTPYANIPDSAYFIGNILSAGNISGIIHQQVAAASSVAWNGRAKLLRLTSSAPTTIDNITLPSGFLIHDTPVIYLYGINNFTITLSSSGNIIPSAANTITLTELVCLVYDYTTSKWLQVKG